MSFLPYGNTESVVYEDEVDTKSAGPLCQFSWPSDSEPEILLIIDYSV